jgi:hypothetical protein
MENVQDGRIKIYQDISALSNDILFTVGLMDRQLYKMEPGSLKLQPVLSSSTTKLQQAKAISKKQIIGLNTKGRVLMLDLNEKIPSWKEFGPTLKFKSISCGEKRRFGRFPEFWAISSHINMIKNQIPGYLQQIDY